MSEKYQNWRLLQRYWSISHDQKSCDIYTKFKWHKWASTTPELQPHYTMRPLSVDKLNMAISRLNSGQTTCQISSTFGVSHGTISKKISLAFLSTLVVILSNSPQPTSCPTTTLITYLREGWNSSTSIQSTPNYHQPTHHYPESVQTPQCNWYEGSGKKERAPSVTKHERGWMEFEIRHKDWILEDSLRTGRGCYGQMRLNSMALGHMTGNGLGKGRIVGWVID